MSAANMNEKRLMRRYLIWCYKTTKEELDRIDRKFTQLKVDKKILNELNKTKNENTRFFEDYKVYIHKKETEALKEKFESDGRTLQKGYAYLKNRLAAVERAIQFFLGKKALPEIVSLYENEMTRRILEAREH